MTKTCLPVILALAVTLLPALAEDWTTTDGKTYKNVTVISHDAKIVTISSSDGTATFPIALLDKDLQKRVQGDNATANDWTVNGKDYHNVTVGKVEPDRVHITYDGGIGTVALADLPPDLQTRFGYDPKKAQAAATKEKEAQDRVTGNVANPVAPFTETNAGVAQTQVTSSPPVSDNHPGVPQQYFLKGFWNIPWGSSVETVKKQMKAESGFAETVSDEANSITYKGGTFANLAVQQLKFRFFHNQLYGALVIFEPATDLMDSMTTDLCIID